MPVASFVATGTACGRLRSLLAHKGVSLPPKPPIPSPARFFRRMQKHALVLFNGRAELTQPIYLKNIVKLSLKGFTIENRQNTKQRHRP